MKDIQCVIIDDDLISQSLIEALIEKTDGLTLVKSFQNPEQGAAYLSNNSLDLVFLDVEMPEMTGMQLLESMKSLPPVIIVSSKEKYAVEAFDLEVADYLVKPIESYARFLKAINRVRGSQNNTQDDHGKLFVKVDSLLVNLDTNDIIWVEAYGDYVKIKTPIKVHMVYSTMKSIEQKLSSTYFMRIHRSYIVRVDKIINIDHTNLEIADKILPIGNKYKADLMKRINVL